jgi:high-affinity iron transporter
LKTTFNIRCPGTPSIVATAGALVLAFCALSFCGKAARAGATDPSASAAQSLVAVLQYLGRDYPAAVASNDAGELEEQRSLAADAARIADRSLGGTPFVARVASIEASVSKGADPAGVSADCAALVDDLIAATGMARAPAAPPDLGEGANLFGTTCAACHGKSGQGDGPAAAALNPRPVNFHSSAVMEKLTPFDAFNAIRFGVRGTAMPAFGTLDEKQRWDLAFYVFSLRQPPCDHAPPRVSLDRLANRSDVDLAKAVGAGEVACLRRKIPEIDAVDLLAAARARVEEAARAFGRGDAIGAERIALDAYLSDVEPAEPWLRVRAADVLPQIEASFMATRAAFHRGDPGARDDALKLVALLDRAAGIGAHATTTRVSAFWFAFFVIVREGFEAAVIVAALLAVLKKQKQTTRARFVHAGWTSAIATGAIGFIAGRKVLAGAMSEKLEGCLAFVAVAMLLYAALWLNGRANTRRAMGHLRERALGALGTGALALFAISFLAVFRESFETAVFLEALSIEAPSAVAWGACGGGALLLALVVAVGRLGLHLPMQVLFRASTVLLVATAVVLLGQGIHTFEVLGLLPSRAMPMFRIEFLGIYPDRLGIIAQATLALAPLVWRTVRLSSDRTETGPHPAE